MTWQPEDETRRELQESRRETRRTRQASWSSDVAVPAGQALLIAAGVAMGVLVIAGSLALWRSWEFWVPFAAAAALGGLAFAAAAVLLTLDHRRLLWAAERALDVDLDQDNVVGEPEAERESEAGPLRVELLDRRGTRQRLTFIDLPGTPERLAALARGLLNGRGTGQAQWTGAGNPFSRNEYEAIRAEMLKQGLANWINPDAHAQGWELTAAGRAVMRKIVEAVDSTQGSRAL